MAYIVIAYDIRDNKRRLRVARALLNALDRVQRSVYEGEVDERTAQRLRERVLPLLDPKEDTLRIYLLCGACQRRVEVHGSGTLMTDPEVWIV